MNRLWLLLLLLLFHTSIVAVNHLDLLTTMTGEQYNSYFGWIMTSLDWNRDGYDDLVVNSLCWFSPQDLNVFNALASGKLYIFLGKPNFNNFPDKTISGAYPLEFNSTFSMCNAGDMNGDGYDDLGLIRGASNVDTLNEISDHIITVYYGGADPDTIPDYELVFPYDEWADNVSAVQSIGDFNHDGYDDLGYFFHSQTTFALYRFGIILGGSMQNLVVADLTENHMYRDNADIRGIGDINADGYDDFAIGYYYTPPGDETSYHRITIYFGNSSASFDHQLVLYDGTGIYEPFSYPAGDLNYDGIADFVSCFGSGYRLYYGSSDFTGEQYVSLSPAYCAGDNGKGFGHGDMNHDGADDLMGTSVEWAMGMGEYGLWLGGVPMNGGMDLHVSTPFNSELEMFGFCLTMGDYNGDGCCDAAISAPFDHAGVPILGRVFVFAGNMELNDPLGNDEETAPAAPELTLSPNPVREGQLTFHFGKELQQVHSVLTATFFNIRGQEVKQILLPAGTTRMGNLNVEMRNLPSGIYFCKVQGAGREIIKKFTYLK